MKITRVEPILVRLPYEHGAPKPALGMGPIRATMDALFVRVETDDGVTGWGEAFGFATVPVTMPAIRDVVGPLAIGRDATDIPALTGDLKRRLQNMMHAGPARFALSALDIALWDIAGKVQDAPVWKLLGGPGRMRVPAYASLLRLPTPEVVAEIAAAAVARGYAQVKLHQKTAEMAAAARRAIGPDVALMVDTNCAWTSVEDAIVAARAMQPYDLTWLEEPISPPDDYESLARLRREGGVPIAIGENLGNPNDVKWMARLDAADIVQPSVVKHGGISAVWEIAAIARERGIRCVPHSPFVGPGLIATIHIVAAMAEDVVCEHRYCDLGASPLGDAVTQQGGSLKVPDGPGLGIEVDEKILERFRAD
jgi:L-alanine-DL-glutamate epimerase-like enolase superfamily enzyme